jgi:hypothetical protein
MDDRGARAVTFPTLKWNKPDRCGGEPVGEISDPEEFDNHASLKILAKDGMALLHKHYPGWTWAIQINERGGMMNVFNFELHDTWGYTIRTIEAEHDPKRRVFLIAGGEILERFGFERKGIDYARLVQMKRDPRGMGIPILSDLEHAAARKTLKRRRIVEAIEGNNCITDAAGRVLVRM